MVRRVLPHHTEPSNRTYVTEIHMEKRNTRSTNYERDWIQRSSLCGYEVDIQTVQTTAESDRRGK